jgi:hypothetical protein
MKRYDKDRDIAKHKIPALRDWIQGILEEQKKTDEI